MAAITVLLSEENQSFVETQASVEGFASTDDYLDSLVQEARLKQAKKAIDDKLRHALSSGPATEMTRENWSRLEQKVWEREGRRAGGTQK